MLQMGGIGAFNRVYNSARMVILYCLIGSIRLRLKLYHAITGKGMISN